jgi:hypothetical protein
MGERSAGEGSLYRRKSDGKWVGAIHLGYADGRRRRKVVYDRTQGEVRDKLQQLRAEHAERRARREHSDQSRHTRTGARAGRGSAHSARGAFLTIPTADGTPRLWGITESTTHDSSRRPGQVEPAGRCGRRPAPSS